MITEIEARKMMENLLNLKKIYDESKLNSDKLNYISYEANCVEELKYFVNMRARKYSKFVNHSDLVQEGMMALLKAIRTFKLKDLDGNNKGSFFFWAALIINTRLSRSANNHTTIRYPMHIAKYLKPHKEKSLPMMIELGNSPEQNYEQKQCNNVIDIALGKLSFKHKEYVSLAYGFGNDKPMSITKICQLKKVSRVNCIRVLDDALSELKANIEILFGRK